MDYKIIKNSNNCNMNFEIIAIDRNSHENSSCLGGEVSISGANTEGNDQIKQVNQASVGYPHINGTFVNEDWSWDIENKPNSVTVDSKRKIAYFFQSSVSEGTAGIRGTKGFKTGIHYFDIKINKPLSGTSVMIGFGTLNTCLEYKNFEYVNLIGADENSWGLNHKGQLNHNSKLTKYCEPLNEPNTVIGVLLDFFMKTITFYKNGVCLGIAYRNVQFSSKNEYLYPIIASTAADIELELLNQFQIIRTLEDICYINIRNYINLKDLNDYEQLDLPKRLIENLKMH